MIVDRKELPEEWDIAFIDSDIIKYQGGFAAETVKYHLYDAENNLVETFDSAKECANHLEELEEFFGQSTEGYRRESEKIVGDEEHAINAADTIIRHIKSKVKAKEYKFYLSGKNNFRDKIATIYKYGHNREKVERPYWVDSIVKHLKETHDAVVVEGKEADDAVSVGITAMTKKGKKAIHCGRDKDIKYGTAGTHYDWTKDEFYLTSPEEALLFNYIQGIAGDATDGFHGVPRIGMKKAEKLLAGCTTEREMYEASVEAYRKHFGDEHTYTSWDGKEMTKTAEQLFFENMSLGYILKEKDKYYTVPEE